MSRTFHSLDPSQSPTALVYDLIVCGVQPRPIALVSTNDEDGRGNLAPFSFFTAGGVNPPSLAYCPSLDGQGRPKNSLRNAEATGEFVVNMVTRAMSEPMAHAAGLRGDDVDEWGVRGLTPIPGELVRPHRVAESPIQFECRVAQVLRLGQGPHGTVYVIGEIVRIHVDAAHLHDGKPDPSRLRAIGKLGGAEYIDSAVVASVFSIPDERA